MAFVAAFNEGLGNDNDSVYNFSSVKGQPEETFEDKEATTGSNGGKCLTKNGTSAPHLRQTVLKDGSRDMLQTERTDETRIEENGGGGYHQRLERMGAMSKEWEAFLRSIAIGGEGVVDSV